MSVNLLPLVMAVYKGELCLTLPVLPRYSTVAARCQEPLNVISFGASSIPPLQRICRCLPKDLRKACAHSFCVTFVSRGRQAILPSTFSCMTCARIASPCFTRPRFELGLSWRAPQVSAKRFRLSCSLNSRVFSSIHHDVLNIGLSRDTCRHHPCTHNAWCSRRLGPELSSCCLAAASLVKV